MVRIRAPDKEIYKGKWELGFFDRLQAYADKEGVMLTICDTHGTPIFQMMPKETPSARPRESPT